ncbi:MAG: ABC transporter substrate-binding protein [Arenicellales bacterium WSBS_2016_MAG_OTU3]
MKSLAVRCAVFICCIYLASVSEARTLFEQPMFQHSITAGDLPPITERVPEQPHVVTLIDERKPGEYGGELRLLMGKAKDTKLLTVYGYARLVGYDEQFNLAPDLLESFAVQDSRIFTFKLRKGHKWSDGHPFTTEDFAYYWNDIATNEILKPYGPPKTLLVDGERPQVDIVDEVTVRYSWSKPNPYFLPALAGASPLFIYSPKHYLKQFHADYMDAQEMENTSRRSGARAGKSCI